MATATDVIAWIQAVQYRTLAATDPTVVNFVNQLNSGQSVAQVQLNIETSSYTLAFVNPVIREYQAAFNRVPDQAGASYWVNTFATTPSALSDMSTLFANSAEFASLYNGANATTPANTQLVTAFYVNVLQRSPDAAGLAFWVGTHDSAAQLLQAFAQSTESQNLMAQPIITFQNLEIAGKEPMGPVYPSIFDLGSSTPGTFTLTPNIDTFTTQATGAIFNALPFVQSSGLANNTLNTGDNLQDSANDGTLNYTASNNGFAANPPFANGVTMNGINTANITNQNPVLGAGGLPIAAGVAGFQGNITGLTVVNDVASINPVRLGGAGQGLNTALTHVNISNYGGPNSNVIPTFAGIIAAKAGSATNTINVAIAGPVGTTAALGAVALQFSTDGPAGTAAAPNLSYGTWAISVDSTSFLQLQQNGVGGATKLALSGAGNIAVGQDAQGNWQKVTTIDASAETGTAFITGATSGVASQALASVANPGWLFGSSFGLLDDTGATFALTSYKLGSGTNFLDVSSATAAQVAALTTTPGTLVALNNEIIVNDGVATTTSATTFANIKGFEILGIGGPGPADGAGGTIDMANLAGTGINELLYQTAASGALTILNQTAPLTVNTEDNALGFAITSTGTGFTDSFTLDVGNPLHNNATFVGNGAGAVGNVTLFNDSIVNINALGHATGGPAITDTVGYVSLTPALGGNEIVTIGGTTALTIGTFGTVAAPGGQGAIADVNSAGALNINNLTITDTDSAVVSLHGPFVLAPPFPPLEFSPVGDTTFITNSTNAVAIDASKSGGIIMAAGDANFTTSGTVAGSIGDSFTGSTTAGDVFGGSIGNDTFTLNAIAAPETIYTAGGADTVTLASGHTAQDRIEFYGGVDVSLPAGAGASPVAPGGVESVFSSTITDFFDIAQLGWWGQATGAAAGAQGYINLGGGNFGYASLTTTGTGTGGGGTGTSLDMSTLANFKAGDVLDFSASGTTAAWNGTGGNGIGAGVALGLVEGNFANFAGSNSNTAGVNAVTQAVNPNGTLGATTNLIELTTGTFADANAVANALAGTGGTSTYDINFAAALGSHNSAHILVAYQDLSGNTRIADLALANTTAVAQTDTAHLDVHASDIAQLTGVHLASLAAHNVQFI